MTREEAIEKLKRERNGVCRGCVHPSMVGWCENHCKLPEAYDMAIEALGQPEIIYCGECELKIECCRNIRSGGRKDDDFCSYGRRAERRNNGQPD